MPNSNKILKVLTKVGNMILICFPSYGQNKFKYCKGKKPHEVCVIRIIPKIVWCVNLLYNDIDPNQRT